MRLQRIGGVGTGISGRRMDNRTVSVVVPTFNRAHLICDALDSAAAQSAPILEIIVVDDGSTDGTDAVIDAWRVRHPDIRLHYIRQKNAGGNVARNRGIDRAEGAYIAFLDSDDLWLPGKLAAQLAALNAHPESGAVYCGVVESVVETGEMRPVEDRPWPNGWIHGALLIRDGTAPTSSWLIRRDLLVHVGGFDEALSARQDWDLWIRVAEKTEISVVKEALTELRDHGGPRTVSNSSRELEAHRLILKKYAARRAALGWRVERAAQAAYFRRAGRVAAHHQGRLGHALLNYARAIYYWPVSADSYLALCGLLIPKSLRQPLRRIWNSGLGRTALGIRNH